MVGIRTAATTALGVARVIRACLPIRCDSSNRVLPTPGDAIPSNGLPPRRPVFGRDGIPGGNSVGTYFASGFEKEDTSGSSSLTYI